MGSATTVPIGRSTRRCIAHTSKRSAAFVEGSRAWLSIDHRFSPDGAAAAWADVCDGSMAPSVGVVVFPNA
jgi:hypothetical protein